MTDAHKGIAVNTWWQRAASVVVLVGWCAGSASGAGTAPAWQSVYTGNEATGPHVVALWQFDAGAGTADRSGRKHVVKLRGQSRFAATGRFGGCLECFAAPKDVPEGAATLRAWADLSPRGPFTVELWMRPKPAMADAKQAFLIDCKYFHYKKDLPQANAGYAFLLRRTGTRWRPVVVLGFGKETEIYTAKPVTLVAGRWHHVAFTYNGAGTVRVCLDGKDVGGGTFPGRGDVAPPQFALAIGARYGSTKEVGDSGAQYELNSIRDILAVVDLINQSACE